MLAHLSKAVRLAVQASAMAVVVVAVVCVVSLAARPPAARPILQPESISVSSTVDRTHKGDRLPPLSPAAERKILPGCERPFSPLAKSSPPIFSGRCLT
jgi:hypothetical protein